MQVLRVDMKSLGGSLGFCQRDADELSRPAAARTGWNRCAVRAGAGVAQECADFIGGFGRKNVLELAGLLLDFGFAVHGEAVGEQALSQTVTANDVGGALTAAGREFNDHAAVAGRDASGF